MFDMIYEFAHESRELATVVSSAGFSLFLALFLTLFTARTSNKILRDFRMLGMVLIGALGFLFFMLGFESLFALVGKRKWGFFPFLALDAAAILAVFFSVFIPLGKLVDRGNIRHMKGNPVLTEVVDIVRRENATAVYCCTDGVRIAIHQPGRGFHDLAQGLAHKARDVLGWNPQKTSYAELVRIMAEHDRALAKREAAVKAAQ